MSCKVSVYIKPFRTDGNYAANWINVTEDVEGLGSISVDTDSSDFQIGVFRNSTVKIDINNRSGKYSDIDTFQSIFEYKRSDSLVRITYLDAEDLPRCGIAICGSAKLVEEIEVFTGLLNDESLNESARTEQVSFQVLGRESVLSRAPVPFASLSNGDTVKQMIVAILSQAQITKVVTVDAANINPALNLAIDTVADYENKTAKDALDKLLLASNSVLYIKGDAVYVSSRAATPDVKHTFFGQGSRLGPENMIDIDKINSGKTRMFNFMNWRSSSEVFVDNDSVFLHGTKKKEVDVPGFTNSGKRVSILQALVTEFKLPKQEFELIAPVNPTTISLALLDRVRVDYPTVYVEGDYPLPICGIAICGQAVLPRGLWSFAIPSSRRYKILKKSMDLKKLESTFKLREI